MSANPEDCDGYVMKLVDEAYPVYSFAWVIDHPDFCCGVRYQSPEFSTGTKMQDAWQIIYTSSINRPQNDLRGHLQLNLGRCEKSQVKKRVVFSFLGSQGEKFFEKQQEIIASKGCVCELYFNNSEMRQLCQINHPKLIVCCRISDKTPSTLISDLICDYTHEMSTPKRRLSDDFEAIMKNERLSDATLVVGGQEFHVHKAILASRSPVFMAAFENDMQEKRSNRIDIPDIKPEVMQELLNYVYTDKIESVDVSAKDLIVAADKYQIEELKSLCLLLLAGNLNEDNAIETLTLANFYNANDLKDQTYKFIAVHVKDINKLEGYKSLEESGLVDLLEALSAIGAVRNVH